MNSFKIHNRFDIEVHNVKTGNVEKYTHYNIVLDNLYNSYFRRASTQSNGFANNIVFGEGTGEVNASRTQLFKPIANKSTTNVYSKIDQLNGTSEAQFKILIEPNEYVGKNITEVGFGTTSSALTHSLIKDAHGNPISITKTEYDKIIIYATVFGEIHVEGSQKPVVMTGGDSDLYLLRYMCGLAAYSSYSIYTTLSFSEIYPVHGPWTTYKGSYYTDRTIDITDGVVKLSRSLNSSQSNGCDIRSIQLNGHDVHYYGSNYTYAGVALPLIKGDAFQGLAYNNIEIGTGDDVKDTFNLPINIRGLKDDCTVKINDVEVDSVEFIKMPGISKCVGDKGILSGFASLGNDIYVHITYETISSTNYYKLEAFRITNDEFTLLYCNTYKDLSFSTTNSTKYYNECFIMPDMNAIVRLNGNNQYVIHNFNHETGELGPEIGRISKSSTNYYQRLYRITDTNYLALVTQGVDSSSYPSKLYKLENNELINVKSLKYIVTDISEYSGNRMRSFASPNLGTLKGDIHIGSSIYRFNLDTLEFERVASGLTGGIQIAPFVRASIVDHEADATYNQLVIYKYSPDFTLSDTIKFDFKFDKTSTYQGIRALKENLFIVHGATPYIVKLNEDDTITLRCNKSELFKHNANTGYQFGLDIVDTGNKIYYMYANKAIEGESEVAEIKFNTPPANGDILTIDYTLDFIPKNDMLTMTGEAQIVWG